MKLINALFIACLGLSTALPAMAHHDDEEFGQYQRVQSHHAAVTMEKFFDALAKKDSAKVLSLFSEDAKLTIVRSGSVGLDRAYQGKDGVVAFLTAFGATFQTTVFVIDDLIGEGEVGFANGNFVQIVKATGKPFVSDWALKCVVKHGLITEYHFYEDSDAYVKAAAN